MAACRRCRADETDVRSSRQYSISVANTEPKVGKLPTSARRAYLKFTYNRPGVPITTNYAASISCLEALDIMAPRNDVPAYVLGVGITKFIKPRQQRAYPEMGYEAGVKAMLDAQINYDDVETGVACYCYGDTTSGQRIFYQFGMSS